MLFHNQDYLWCKNAFISIRRSTPDRVKNQLSFNDAKCKSKLRGESKLNTLLSDRTKNEKKAIALLQWLLIFPKKKILPGQYHCFCINDFSINHQAVTVSSGRKIVHLHFQYSVTSSVQHNLLHHFATLRIEIDLC